MVNSDDDAGVGTTDEDQKKAINNIHLILYLTPFLVRSSHAPSQLARPTVDRLYVLRILWQQYNAQRAIFRGVLWAYVNVFLANTVEIYTIHNTYLWAHFNFQHWSWFLPGTYATSEQCTNEQYDLNICRSSWETNVVNHTRGKCMSFSLRV